MGQFTNFALLRIVALFPFLDKIYLSGPQQVCRPQKVCRPLLYSMKNRAHGNNKNADLRGQWTESRNLQHAVAFHSVCNLWQGENERETLSTSQILEIQHKLDQLDILLSNSYHCLFKTNN